MKRIILIFIFISSVSYASTVDTFTRTLGLTLPQFNSILTYPFNHLDQSAWFGLSHLALVSVDVQTTDFVQQNINSLLNWKLFTNDYFPFFFSEDEILILGLSAVLGYGFVFEDVKSVQAATLSFQAAFHSYIFSHIIYKTLFARMRPLPNLRNGLMHQKNIYSSDPWAFGRFHSPYLDSKTYGTAFPSFHFTMFFSVARVFDRVYQNPFLAYSICTLGLLPNFSAHHHWVSDMVAGALIGVMIGDMVTSHLYPKKDDSIGHIQLTPIFSPSGYGGQFKIIF